MPGMLLFWQGKNQQDSQQLWKDMPVLKSHKTETGTEAEVAYHIPVTQRRFRISLSVC